MLRLVLINITIPTITSHTYMFDETHNGDTVLSFLVPLDIVISIARIALYRFDVVINTVASFSSHVSSIIHASLYREREMHGIYLL
jgi:hypothetical protein